MDRKMKAQELFDRLEKEGFELIGCGVDAEGIMIIIYSENKHIGNLPNNYKGYKVSYEYSGYPEFA